MSARPLLVWPAVVHCGPHSLRVAVRSRCAVGAERQALKAARARGWPYSQAPARDMHVRVGVPE